MTRARWLVTWAAVTVLFWVADLLHPVNTTDPAWFLQISERLNAGEAPYRDFFLGVLPFPLWLTSAATSLAGSDIAVLKLIVAASYTGTAMIGARVALMLRVPPGGAALVAVVPLAFVFLPSSSPYSPLSYLLMMVTLAAALAWERAGRAGAGPRTTWLLAGAGVAAGLSCAGKQTVGAAALAALLVCVVLYSHRPRADLRGSVGDCALAAGCALAVLALCLLPVVLTGGLDEMRTQAFSKGEYLSTSSIPYTDGLSKLWSLLGDPISGRTQLRFHVVFLLPPLAAVLLAAAAFRSPRRDLIPVAAFLVAAVVPALPRAAYFKVSDAVPFCALAVVVAWPLVFGEGSVFRRREALVGIAAGFACLVLAGLNLARTPIASSGELVRADLPHFELVAMTEDQRERASEQVERLRAADGGENRTFVFSASAGFLYLVSGLENPTSNDYPVRTTLRDDGADEVIEAIRAGEIERVCVGDFGDDPDARVPELEEWIAENMVPDASEDSAGPVQPEECVIYSARGVSG